MSQTLATGGMEMAERRFIIGKAPREILNAKYPHPAADGGGAGT
jgi:hypothetical protein